MVISIMNEFFSPILSVPIATITGYEAAHLLLPYKIRHLAISNKFKPDKGLEVGSMISGLALGSYTEYLRRPTNIISQNSINKDIPLHKEISINSR